MLKYVQLYIFKINLNKKYRFKLTNMSFNTIFFVLAASFWDAPVKIPWTKVLRSTSRKIIRIRRKDLHTRTICILRRLSMLWTLWESKFSVLLNQFNVSIAPWKILSTFMLAFLLAYLLCTCLHNPWYSQLKGNVTQKNNLVNEISWSLNEIQYF